MEETYNKLFSEAAHWIGDISPTVADEIQGHLPLDSEAAVIAAHEILVRAVKVARAADLAETMRPVARRYVSAPAMVRKEVWVATAAADLKTQKTINRLPHGSPASRVIKLTRQVVHYAMRVVGTRAVAAVPDQGTIAEYADRVHDAIREALAR